MIVKNCSYLCVNLDNKLSFEKFINGTISRVNARLITLARIRKNVNAYTALLIFFFFFLLKISHHTVLRH